MAAQIFDIDGTIVDYHTNKWIEGALTIIHGMYLRGDDIILITMRGPQDEGTEWSMENTTNTILKDLDDLGIKYRILFSVQSPRVLHDDGGAYLIKRSTNQKYY